VAEAPNRFLNAWRHISARGGAVTVLPSVERHCEESTANRKL
jgi:hypothetical protein